MEAKNIWCILPPPIKNILVKQRSSYGYQYMGTAGVEPSS